MTATVRTRAARRRRVFASRWLRRLSGTSTVSAFVLITVVAKRSGDVVHMLMEKYPEFVTEAAAVYGESDVIAKVVAPVEKFHELVMDEIQNLPNVKVTRTFVIIPQLHEVR